MSDVANETLQYHGMLNPVAWQGMVLKPDIRNALLNIGKKFIETWGFDIPVKDIILTGSNANFNWTSFSDFDVHVVANMKAVPAASKEFVENYLKVRKQLWNKTKHITVKGFSVELYAQDDEEILISDGVYSLMTQKWLKKPKKVEPHINQLAVREKVEDLTHQIEEALAGGMQEAPMELLKKLANMRKSALQTAGEFSVENLAFKVLRNNGMIGKLRDALEEYTTRNLTLESTHPKDRSLKIRRNKWKERVVDDQTEETITELSHGLRKRYVKAAVDDIQKQWNNTPIGSQAPESTKKQPIRSAKFWGHVERVIKRTAGIRKAEKNDPALLKFPRVGSSWTESVIPSKKKSCPECGPGAPGWTYGDNHGDKLTEPPKVPCKTCSTEPLPKRKTYSGSTHAATTAWTKWWGKHEGGSGKKVNEEQLSELSKDFLKVYRDEARKSGIPPERERAPYGHTVDDYGPKAAKHQRGVETATKKIIQHAKNEAKAAKLAATEKKASPEKVAAAAERRSKWVASNPEKAKRFGVKEEAEPLQETGLTVYGRWKKARVAKIWGWKRNKFKKKALAQSATNKVVGRRSGLSARRALYKKILRGGDKKKLAYSARKSVEGAVRWRDKAFISIPGTRTQWKSRRRDSRRASGTGVIK